jgi:hypothetical protein
MSSVDVHAVLGKIGLPEPLAALAGGHIFQGQALPGRCGIAGWRR